jgi:heavy metal sensor kinase
MGTLRFKLISWFLLVLLIVLVVFGLLLYLARERSLYATLDSELQNTALQLANQVDIEKEEVFLKSGEFTFPKDMYYEITNEKGELISKSTTLQEHNLPFVSPDKEKQNFIIQSIPSWEKHPLRLITLKKIVREESDDEDSKKPSVALNSQTLFIQCAKSTWLIDEELEELVNLIFWVGLATFLIAGLGGFFLAGRALLPIKQITQTVQDLSETHLSERIDISKFDKEFHPLATQLNAALERLEKAFQRERQFTSDASHELRTPLSVIVNNIEVLLKRQRSPEEHVEIHQSNLETSHQMQHIIEGLLTLTRIDAGQISLQKKEINLYNLMEEVFGNLQSKAAQHKVSLINQIEKNTSISVAEDKFKQVLINLLDNAITYNRPDGSVTVASQKENSGITIKIIDTGIGIRQEHLTHIFERFYRVDPSRSEKTGGCGLGLSIVKSIMELHGGSISVTSDNDGSIFTITLPNN